MNYLYVEGLFFETRGDDVYIRMYSVYGKRWYKRALVGYGECDSKLSSGCTWNWVCVRTVYSVILVIPLISMVTEFYLHVTLPGKVTS